jgi:transposase
MNAAVIRIGHRVGVNPDTLRGWVKQARIDAGEFAGVTTVDAATIKALEREVRELKRANEILLSASSFFARELEEATSVLVAFIDEHRSRSGVEPICRVLSEHGVKIAPLAITRSRLARIRPARCATRTWSSRSSGCSGTATSAAVWPGRGECGVCCTVKA